MDLTPMAVECYCCRTYVADGQTRYTLQMREDEPTRVGPTAWSYRTANWTAIHLCEGCQDFLKRLMERIREVTDQS